MRATTFCHIIFCHSFTNVTFTIKSLSVSLRNRLTTPFVEKCGINVNVLDCTVAGNIEIMSSEMPFKWEYDWFCDTLICQMNKQIWMTEHWTVAFFFTLLTWRHLFSHSKAIKVLFFTDYNFHSFWFTDIFVGIVVSFFHYVIKQNYIVFLGKQIDKHN